VVPHELLISAEDASGLHGSATLRTKNALNHDAAAHIESPAIVADPVIVRYFVDAIASLMDRNVASSTKDDEILILIVTVVADGALGIFLYDKASLVRTK